MNVPRPVMQAVSGVPADNYGGKRPTRPTHITLHHIVGDAPAALARFRQPVGVSSTFVIGSDGTIYQVLPIDTIPYTDGNYRSNLRAITIEHAGGHPTVPYTDAMYNASAQLCAWLRQEYGIPESNILLHRDVIDRTAYPGGTACPGALDTERIKRESTKQLEDEPVIRDLDNEYWRWNKLGIQIRGRDLTRDEFRASAVGRTWLNALEILSDDPEADNATNDQNTGSRASNEKWLITINRLQAERDEMQANLVKANQRIDALQSELEASKTNTATAIETATKKAPTATKSNWFVRLVAALMPKP